MLLVLQLMIIVQFEIFATRIYPSGIAELETTSYRKHSLSFIRSLPLYELSICDIMLLLLK